MTAYLSRYWEIKVGQGLAKRKKKTAAQDTECGPEDSNLHLPIQIQYKINSTFGAATKAHNNLFHLALNYSSSMVLRKTN
jgi:hypothetical protein